MSDDRRGHADHVHRAGCQHQVPQFACVARAAAVLADEDAQEIFQSHVLEPPDRFDHDVMALAAQNSSGDQNDLCVALDAPRCTHRLDAFARDTRRIEAIEINTAWHDRDLVPGCSVAVIDQLSDLLT